MKLTATVVLTFQARTLAEAGARLDDVLDPARKRGDIEVESVELQTPSASVPVTIPYTPRQPSPHSLPGASA